MPGYTSDTMTSGSSPVSALVLFSGGQDSATALVWALDRFRRVETVGFYYQQRHRVELDCRISLRQHLRRARWRNTRHLGPDHLLDLTALGKISSSALNTNTPIRVVDTAPPTSFVAGRNPIFLAMAAALAVERRLDCLVAGMSQNDAADYPDCRAETIAALETALSLGLGTTMPIIAPLIHLTKAQTWKLAHDLGGAPFINLLVEHSHSCYLGDRVTRHRWGYGCSGCPACREREGGWRMWMESSTP